MTGRRLSSDEIDAILAHRRASAQAAMKGRAHRALPLDVVDRLERGKRVAWPDTQGVAWPMICGACNTGTPGNCDCPTAGASSDSGIENEPPYNQRSPKARMGRLTLVERVLLSRRPTYTWAAVLVLAIFCAFVRVYR